MTLTSDIQKFAKQVAAILEERKIEAVRLVLAAECIALIQKRTRQGSGIARQGGEVRRLKGLSPSYIKFRQSNRIRLSPFTSPTKSNLTFTNQMLGSLDVVGRGKQMAVAPTGRRSDGKSNQEIADYVSEDRPFLFLSPQELDQAQRRAVKTFEDLVKGI